MGPTWGSDRVYRGGIWLNSPWRCLSPYRFRGFRVSPDYGRLNLRFRISLVIRTVAAKIISQLVRQATPTKSVCPQAHTCPQATRVPRPTVCPPISPAWRTGARPESFLVCPTVAMGQQCPPGTRRVRFVRRPQACACTQPNKAACDEDNPAE